MKKSNNDMDKIMDLFLYIFPKYLDKINEHKNDRDIVRKVSMKKVVNKPTLKEPKIKENNHNVHKDESLKSDHKLEENEKDNNEVHKDEPLKNDHKLEEIEKDNLTKSNDTKSTSKGDVEMTDKESNMFKNEVYNICVDGMEKILKVLIGEKVDISITDSTMFLLNSVIILSVKDTIVKVKTTVNTTIIIPIQEIVAIRCNSIYGISFEDDCDLEACKREESLRRYFTSIIGKKIFLQTKGQDEFKYINNRIITGTGRGVVIIEGAIAISLSKIILIQEMV